MCPSAATRRRHGLRRPWPPAVGSWMTPRHRERGSWPIGPATRSASPAGQTGPETRDHPSPHDAPAADRAGRGRLLSRDVHRLDPGGVPARPGPERPELHRQRGRGHAGDGRRVPRPGQRAGLHRHRSRAVPGPPARARGPGPRLRHHPDVRGGGDRDRRDRAAVRRHVARSRSHRHPGGVARDRGGGTCRDPRLDVPDRAGDRARPERAAARGADVPLAARAPADPDPWPHRRTDPHHGGGRPDVRGQRRGLALVGDRFDPDLPVGALAWPLDDIQGLRRVHAGRLGVHGQAAAAGRAAGTLGGMVPETRYARLGDLHLAYQVLGEGPPDLLVLDDWFGHVDAQWDVPPLAEFRERLASFGRLIMFDKRGTGLSDPIPTSSLPTLEEFMADIPAVLDTVGSERPALIANIGGGMLAMPYAAAHPERVSSLILVDCFARFTEAPDFPIGAPREAVGPNLEIAEREAGRGAIVDMFAPSMASDERLRRAWGRYERSASTPGSTRAIVRLIYESDVRDVLPAIRVPTLVIHRRDAIGFSVEHGRYLAQHIPDARYVEMPGPDNLIWAGDLDAMVAEIQGFVTGVRPAPEPRRVLATVLFTDIVGSTERAAQLGDVRWRGLLADHNRVVRRQLDRFVGTEIKTAGDGFLATFDGPARAVRCAIAIRDEVRDLGLEIRAGLHVGEIEVLPDDIGGLAVHLGARVSALAGPGEVLVSSTVKDLVVGSGIAFEDGGTHVLKGVPGEWHLFRVA